MLGGYVDQSTYDVRLVKWPGRYRGLPLPPIARLHLVHTLTVLPLATMASHSWTPLLPHMEQLLLNNPISISSGSRVVAILGHRGGRWEITVEQVPVRAPGRRAGTWS